MRVAVIVGPYKTATEAEHREIRQVQARLVRLGWCAVFLPYALQCALDDQKPDDRKLALEASDAFVRLVARDPANACFLVGNRMTVGMVRDIQTWRTERDGQRHAANVLALQGIPAPLYSDLHAAVRRVTWDDTRDSA